MMILALAACCQDARALNPSVEINQYEHTGWTARDGIFKGLIQTLAQTPDGYLWIGTDSGLYRFDGVRSVSFQPPGGEKLRSNRIFSLLVSRDGKLWIATADGLASWKDGRLTHYPEFGGRFVYKVFEDRAGVIYVSAGAPLWNGKMCALRNSRWECTGDDVKFGTGVFDFYEDHAGNLWLLSEVGLWRWKPGVPKLYPIPVNASSLGSILEGDDGNLWLGMRGGIRPLIGEHPGDYLRLGKRQFRTDRVYRDRDGALWISTVDLGLLHVYQGKTDTFGRADGLTANYAMTIFEDREGNIWVATISGLDRFRDLAAPRFSTKQGLSNDTIDSVLTSRDGSVWMGSYDGMNRWKDGKNTIYRVRPSLREEVGQEVVDPGLRSNGIRYLFEDSKGRIWVATAAGLTAFDGRHFVPGNDVPREVYGFVEERPDEFWVNDGQGLIHLTNGRVVETVPWSRFEHDQFAREIVADGSRGGLFVGLYQGGVRHFKDGKVIESSEDSYKTAAVRQLRRDESGAIWAATEGGLSRLNKGRIDTMTSQNGLPCDSVLSMIEDDDRALWLYLSCGMARVTRSDLDGWMKDSRRKVQPVVLGESDGVLNRSDLGRYGPRTAKSKDGKLWFVQFDGITVIDPHRLALNKLPPPVHIEEVKADGAIHDATRRGETGMRLPALSRDLEIDYTGLSLVAPEKNRFRVKLEGWDRDWKDAGNEHRAFYSNLPPRSYRFRVMAANNSGVWNEAGDFLDFSIDPAYYQTRWFEAACGMAFLALLWGVYRYRVHQIAREYNMRMDERVNERTRLARDLHDTLLQGFQGLILRLQALGEMLPRGEAKDELERTLERADQVVTDSRKTVHDLRLSTVVTNDVARAIRTMGEELSSEGTATFELVVEGEAREMHPIVRDEVYRITREALRNAFSHARASHIEAEITYGELFRLRIRDDGEGIGQEILEKGRTGHYGLAGMRERAAEIGAKLEIWSGAGSGTEIDLSIPGSIAYGKRSREKGE
jgi:signal transduction histidine kinase/ligand-binding sensor domain-containing protein